MSETETLTVDLPVDIVHTLRARVEAGDYRSESEAVIAAIDALSADEQWQADLDAALANSIAEADAGLGIPIEEARRQLLARYVVTAA